MGWASGSGLAEDAWLLVREYVPADRRRDVALDFLRLFEEQDADAWGLDDSLIRDAGRNEFFEDEGDVQCPSG